MSLSVLAADCHAGGLLTVFCLESQPGHQQTPTAWSGETSTHFDIPSLSQSVSIVVHLLPTVVKKEHTQYTHPKVKALKQQYILMLMLEWVHE